MDLCERLTSEWRGNRLIPPPHFPTTVGFFVPPTTPEYLPPPHHQYHGNTPPHPPPPPYAIDIGTKAAPAVKIWAHTPSEIPSSLRKPYPLLKLVAGFWISYLCIRVPRLLVHKSYNRRGRRFFCLVIPHKKSHIKNPQWIPDECHFVKCC